MPAPVLQQHPNRNCLFPPPFRSLLIYIMYVNPHIYNMYEASPPSRTYCVSTIFHFSLFPKIRKCNSHSSFFILHLITASARFFTLPSSLFTKRKSNSHSSFFILHSSFKKSHCVGRVTARYFPCFSSFSLTYVNEKANNVYFSKKNPQKFW